ncbi:MAG TPA: FMN-binding protein [Propionibacteriaceae bacterium]|nr:FMN-binding protein [Propionibacteriaceae bacterium]
MSTRAKFAASVASAGVVALGWHHYAGAAPATSTAAQPLATTTVTVTKTPSATATKSSASAAKKTSSKRTTTAKKTTSAATSSTSTTTQAQSGTQGGATQNQGGNQTQTQTQTQTQQTTTASTGWKNGTFTGQTVSQPYGTVQVTVTISGGRISNLTEQLTETDSRSQYIDQQAVPMIKQEVLSADSASVSTIGGATFTSAAYLQSLQSALNQA